ncbi:7028_t:CDS:2 [Dentiscutata erythropus]|uniref:7028_t:CDS:1 n=1 Tax=Dentiscutata erythropus TaxID=1348616 RepID=A0A9N9CUT4_9GLOM|nr:7028_t:CDS:2 [Dentiscutata erythropus]
MQDFLKDINSAAIAIRACTYAIPLIATHSPVKKYIIIFYIVLILTTCSVHAVPKSVKRHDSNEGTCTNFCKNSKLPPVNFSSEQLTGFYYNRVISLNKSTIFEFKFVNFEPGAASNKSTEFDKFPQAINGDGNVIGHYHFTIQKIPSLDNVPDPTTFAFFTLINFLPNATGTYQISVPGLTKEGTYRACTYTTAKAHQCVNVTTGDRGPIDDCIHFKVEKN